MPQAPAVLIADTDVNMTAAETAETCNEGAVSEYSYESYSADEGSEPAAAGSDSKTLSQTDNPVTKQEIEVRKAITSCLTLDSIS